MTLNTEKLRQILENKGIELQEGLTEEEFEKIENFYNIKFPKVLKILYESFLPPFYNWRDFSEKNVETIKYYLNWPINGMKFDIAFNGFWLECFGERTDDMEQNQIKAEEYMRNSKEEEVPRLIPIYSHRYVPSFPDSIDVPVFSVYQTDIIYYGNNIENYFEHEFNKNYKDDNKDGDIGTKEIPFWSHIVDLNI